MDVLPVGAAVDPAEMGMPNLGELSGRYVTLRSLHPQRDAQTLYPLTHGDAAPLWTYMPYGPFASVDSMRDWMETCAVSADPLYYAVRTVAEEAPVGMTSLLNIVPDHRRVEIGHVWYVPHAQRTRANTEAAYLLLEAVFAAGYRRVEWKCDALNARSRAAALRLGFQFEGVFRQHIIVKGRNRDTAWFSMIDGEWSLKKRRLAQWLYANQDGALSLSALNA